MTGKKILLMAALLMATAVNAQVYGGGRANNLRTRHTIGARPVTRPKTTRTTPVVNQTIKTVRVNPDGSTSETTITNSNVNVPRGNSLNHRNNNAAAVSGNSTGYSIGIPSTAASAASEATGVTNRSVSVSSGSSSSGSSRVKKCPKAVKVLSGGGCFNGTYECTKCGWEVKLHSVATSHSCSNCGKTHVRSGLTPHRCKCTSSVHNE